MYRAALRNTRAKVTERVRSSRTSAVVVSVLVSLLAGTMISANGLASDGPTARWSAHERAMLRSL